MATRYIRRDQRVFWGDGSLSQLSRELDRIDAARVMVVTGRTLGENRAVLALVDSAIRACAASPRVTEHFPGAAPQTPVSAVRATVDAIEDFSPDALIALGGGSALVTTRAAAILHGENRTFGTVDPEDLCTRRGPEGTFISPRLRAPKTPVIALPTSPTTAVSTAGCALTTDVGGARLAMYDPAARAHAIVLDPRLLVTAPMPVTVSCSLNAIAMAVEGILSRSATFFTDSQLGHALGTMVNVLPEVVSNGGGAEQLLQLALAATSIGDATETSGAGLAAAISHTLAHRTQASNGVIDSLILPHVLDYLDPVDDDRQDVLARSLNCPTADIRQSLDSFFSSLGLPRRLRDLHVPESALQDAARDAMTDFAVTSSPRTVTPADALDVLRAAW